MKKFIPILAIFTLLSSCSKNTNSSSSYVTSPASVTTSTDSLSDKKLNLEFIEYASSITVTGLIEDSENVIIPNTINGKMVTSVSSKFSNYSKLKSVSIGKNVNSLGYYVFSNCPLLEKIEIDSENTNYYGKNCIIQKNNSNLIYAIKDAIIENGVKTFSAHAFNHSNIESIVVPESVTDIGITSQSILTKTFSYCDNLKEIKVDPKNTTYSSIYDGSERNCIMNKDCSELLIGLENSSLPDSIITLNRFAYMDRYLTSYEVNKNIKTINASFNGAHPLTSFKVNQENTNFKYESGVILNGTGDTLICKIDDDFTIPNTVVNLDSYCFAYANFYKEVILPKSLKTIGSYAFCYSNINKINIPASVSVLNDYQFAYASLNEVTLNEGLTSIGDHAFYQCSLKKLDIPDSVTSIGYYAIAYCDNLTEINFNMKTSKLKTIQGTGLSNCKKFTSLSIPKNVTTIYITSDTFNYVNNFKVDEENTTYTSQDASGNEINVLMNKSRNKLLRVFDKNYKILDSIKTLGPYCFNESKGDNYTSTVDLSSTNIEEIREYAFCYTKTSSLKLPNKLVTLYGTALTTLSNLTSIELPNSLRFSSSANQSSTFSDKVTDIKYNGTLAEFKTSFQTQDNLKRFFSNSLDKEIKILDDNKQNYVSYSINNIPF